MRVLLAIVTFTALGPFSCLAAQAENEKQTPPSKALVAISGADSHVRKPTYERISTPEDWYRVWARHLGTTKDDAYCSILEVDFDRCLVVAIFRGEETNIRGIRIDSLLESTDSIVIRFVRLGYQTAGSDNNKPPDRPYAFVIVPKTDKSIVLEQRIQAMGDQQQQWEECAQLAGRQAYGQHEAKP
ncbi:MAG TPA: hypothetical protein VGM76_18395 [Lacipirellulaceae bacterium]|jgi:hypothetical protein